jgi:glycerate kinase
MIDLLHIEDYIIESDVVVVGEGRLDDQTLFGKAPFGIALMAKKHNKRVIGLFGSRTDGDVSHIIDDVYTVVPKHATEEESLLDAENYFRLMLDDIKL